MLANARAPRTLQRVFLMPRTLPVPPPPQKNMSPPSDSSPGDVDARRQLQGFEHLAGARVDVPELADLAFPGGMPEFVTRPGHPGHEAIGLDGT